MFGINRTIIFYLPKEGRLKPCVCLVLYYGEEDWDGAKSLHELLEMEPELKPYVADYRLNLVSVKDADAFIEHLQDIKTKQFFAIVKMVLNQEMEKLKELETVDRDVLIAAASAVNSRSLARKAIESEKEDVEMYDIFERMVINYAKKEIEEEVHKEMKKKVQEEVEKKVQEEVEKKVQKEVDRVNQLNCLLIKRECFDDLKRSTIDQEYQEELFKRYNL